MYLTSTLNFLSLELNTHSRNSQKNTTLEKRLDLGSRFAAESGKNLKA